MAHCDDGSQYSGDMIAGADGIYSKTHEAMWRAADAVEPDVIPEADREVVFSEYRCLYGIAEGVDGLEL